MAVLEQLAKVATEVAEDQWGLVTRAQALDIGVPPATFGRLVGARVLVRVAHGVYRIAGGADPGLLELRAAWLQLDPGQPAWERLRSGTAPVVSHRSAAEVYAIGDLIADVHEFTVARRTQSRRDDLRLHVRQLASSDWEMVSGLPVTRPHRIVADLLAAREDGSAVAGIATEAVDRGLTTRPALATALDPLAARYRAADGASLVRQMLGSSG